VILNDFSRFPRAVSVSVAGRGPRNPWHCILRRRNAADPGPSPSGEIAGFAWTGEVAPQKWMNFYTKVLSRFATGGGLKLSVTVDVAPPGGTTAAKLEETRAALRELGLVEAIATKSR